MIAHRAVRGTVYVLFSSYSNMVLGIVYGIIMARLLDPEHFGIFALSMFLFSVFDLRGKLGLDFAFIHRQPTTDRLVATHWVLQTGIAVLTLGIVGVAGLVISFLGYSPVTAMIMTVVAGAMIIEAAGATARISLEKELAFARSTVVVTGSLFFSYLIAIGLATLGYGYWALVGQVVANALCSCIGFWWVYRQAGQYPLAGFKFDRDIASWMIRFGAVLTVGALATVLLLQFDNFLVGTIVGTATLGFYTQAYKVAQWPTGLVTHIVGRISLPTYAKLQSDPLRLSKAFEMSLWLILTLAIPLALGIFVSAPDFLILLYGEKWLPSALLLRFLVGYSVLRPLLDDTGALFTAMGQPNRLTLILVVQALVLVIVATGLTWFAGANGTAIGVGLTFLVGVILAYGLVTRAIPIELGRIFGPSIFASVISLGVYFIFTLVVDLNSMPLLFRFISKSSVVMGAFYAFLFLIEHRTMLERIQYIHRLFVAKSV